MKQTFCAAENLPEIVCSQKLFAHPSVQTWFTRTVNMQSVLCRQLPLAGRGQGALAKRQSGVLSRAAPAPRLRVVVKAEDRERQSLTGEWSANWSLASCESGFQSHTFCLI